MFEMEAKLRVPEELSVLFKFSTILLLLNIGGFPAPVSGFSLKTCRVSYTTAICIRKQLQAVPGDIPPMVTNIDLSSNKLSNIRVGEFRNLPVLTQLDLNRNKISHIDEGAFVGLVSLRKLNLNNNRLVGLDGVFAGLTNLTELRLSSNAVSAVPPTAFESLTNLKVLDLSYNKLRHMTNVRSILQQLPHLNNLVIKKIDLTTFQSWEPTNASIALAYLDMSQNTVAVFRMTTRLFPNLTWLNIGGPTKKQQMTWDVHNGTAVLGGVASLDIGGVRLMPDDIRVLFESFNFSLTTLRMNAMVRQQLAALIDTSCTIPTLSKLQFRRNGVRLVSSHMFQSCTNITDLDLAENLISVVHDNAFRSFRGLRILSLSRNRLQSVPAAVRNQPTLGELDLGGNNITSLSCRDFTNLTRLRQLSLHRNSISALNECVFQDLVRLQVLKLQTNHIRMLNGAFGKHLPNLLTLRLEENDLTVIPNEAFAGLQSLQNLTLHTNHISQLENECFVGLTQLVDMQLQGNDITRHELDQDVFRPLISLRRLDLRENHIKYNSSALLQPPFSQLSRLETLAVPGQRGRGKSHLPVNFLQGLTSLQFFDTRNGQLLSLHQDTFNSTPQLQTLYISSNDLTDVSPRLFAPIPNLRSLYISRTGLGSLDFLIKANLSELVFLQARRNAFSVISEDVVNAVPALVYLDLEGNSFTCDCDNAWFLWWAANNKQTQVSDADSFTCNYPRDLKGKKLLDLDVRSCSVDTGFIHFVVTTCANVLFVLTSLIYHFLRWQLAYAYHLFLALILDRKQKRKADANLYDAFISYNAHDEPWVVEELLPKLEGEQGWRLCLHHRDFQPGTDTRPKCHRWPAPAA